MKLTGSLPRSRSLAKTTGIAGILLHFVGSAAFGQPPWTVKETRILGADLDIDGRGAVQLAPDGTLYVLNYTSSEVLRVDSDGKLIWRAGKRGMGPGEFAQAYKLAPRPNGGVAVYDAARKTVVFFDRSGAYKTQRRLTPSFSQVDDIIEMPTGEIVIAGIVEQSPAGLTDQSGKSLHVFSPDMVLLRSFGPVPLTADTTGFTLRFWGAGQATLSADGSLWFSRKLPYELYRFRIDGTPLQSIRMPRVEADPADFMNHRPITRNGRPGVRHSVSGRDVPRPARAIEFGSAMLLTGLYRKGGGTLDVVSRSGTALGSTPLPAGWVSIVGFDPVRSFLWATATVDDVPVLVRQRISFQP